MEDFGSMLNQALQNSGLPYMRIRSMPNPHWPLHFERLCGTYEDPKLEHDGNMGNIAAETSTLSVNGGALAYTCKDGAKVYKATLKALEGHGCYDSRKAVECAKAALAIHPVCPEAYNVLAINASNNYEEALEYFKKAVEQGTLIHDEDDLKCYLESTDLFSIPPMRAYYRGLFGVGNTLRKMGRFKEALVYYEKLAKLDQNPGSSGMSYINYNAHLPELWLRVYGPEECLKRALKYKNKDCIEYHSCQIPWYANLTLALFAAGHVTTYKFPEMKPRTGPPDFTKEAVQGCYAPIYLLRNHPLVCHLLTGMRRMPGGKIPTNIPGSDSLVQAAVYATSCLDLWENTPGALEYLRKMTNTQSLGDKMSKAVDMTDPNIKLAPLLKLLDDGIFPNALHIGEEASHQPLLHMAIFQRPCADIVVEKLIAAGANVKVEVKPGLTALHKACYYACGRAVIRSLVAAGLDPLYPSPAGVRLRKPIMMAAEQGNWEELDECLNLLPNGSLPGLFQDIFNVMMSSSCIECVGGGEKCGRCANGDKKHGPNVSYTKIADNLIERGFRLYSLEQLKDTIGTRSRPYDDLLKYIYQKFKNLPETAGVPGCAFVGCDNGNEAGSVSLKLCVGCRSVKYCCKECQVADWRAHKAACKAAQGGGKGKISKKK